MIIEVAAERQLAIELRNALFFTAVENIYPRAVGKLMKLVPQVRLLSQMTTRLCSSTLKTQPYLSDTIRMTRKTHSIS